ncbi:MAG: RTX toxin, partial [Burkholderiaceae bacterium]|nr:RTX toxin [Burkholderiaceae bacterium]
EAGIASVKLGSTQTDTSYGDAQLVQSGSFTRADGSEGQAGSFILAQNNAVTTHAPIAISAEAAALPGIQGSGWVRNLQEAATLTPQLLELFGNAQGAGSRAVYSNDIGALLLEWGNDSAYITASEAALAEDGIGLVLRNPGDDQEFAWVDMAINASKEDREAFRSTLSAADRGKFDTMRQEMVGDLEKLYAYEAFTGCTFLDWAVLKTKETPPAPPQAGTGRPVEFDVPLSEVMKLDAYATPGGYPGYKVVHIPAPRKPGTKPYIDMLWDRLVADASKNMMPSMRLSQYADMVQLNVSATGVGLDFSQMDAALDAASAADAYEGAALFLDIYRTHGET